MLTDLDWHFYGVVPRQTWNNAQACKQCLCKFMKYCVHFQDLVAIYIENPKKGLCKADFDCVN